jgi:hypothetical protein
LLSLQNEGLENRVEMIEGVPVVLDCRAADNCNCRKDCYKMLARDLPPRKAAMGFPCIRQTPMAERVDTKSQASEYG